MSLAFIGLGSNLGDGCQNLQKAWQLAGNKPEITTLAISSPYLTRPVNKKAWTAKGKRLSDQWFTNAVGVLETGLPPQLLLGVLKKLESTMGRVSSKTVNRPVDMDILYYDDLVLCRADLDIPHPEIRHRRFVLTPLAEIAPDHKHPVTGLTTRQMIRALPPCDCINIRQIAWANSKGDFVTGTGVDRA
jgi:2-amino-4-hydroxy-6-hydroxymethyldihydropteridine diphosphokinase